MNRIGRCKTHVSNEKERNMKKIIALIAAVAMALSLAACGGGGRGAGITVDNEVGYDGAYLYVSPTSESQWGDDLLNGQTLATGSTARV